MPVNFEKSVLQPVQVINWLGYTLDLRRGRVHVTNKKVQEILRLLEDTDKTVGSMVTARKLAKITGKLMACSLALQPVRLMSRECYALLRCKNKADWDKAVHLSAGCVDELLFWSAELLKWNAHGRGMFPDAEPCTVRIEGDASPDGWGARGRWAVDSSAGRGYVEAFEAWTPDESANDQTMRELMCLKESLIAMDNRGVDFSDKRVRARLESTQAIELLDLRPGEAAKALRGELIGYDTDNTGVAAAVNNGGSHSPRVNELVRDIWRWLLQRGSRLEVRWVAGTHMCLHRSGSASTDALSRQRWADGCDWTFFRARALKLRQWAAQWGSPVMVFTRDVVSGQAYAQEIEPGQIAVAFPGGNQIVPYVGWLRQTRRLGCVVTPRWHGPAMAAVQRFKVAELDLGPAYANFQSPTKKKIPGWRMAGYIVDFRSG
jgi:hypothetical protein